MGMNMTPNKFIAASLFEARSETPLTENEMRKLAPSIFAPHEHESCSAKFRFYSTWDAVMALQDRGFMPVSARQGRSRIEGKEFFTKHLIRFRREDMLTVKADKKETEGGFVPEVLLMNAHDRTSSWRVMGGGFRPVCRNGLVIADKLHEERIGHTKLHLADVIDATYRVVDHAVKITDQTRRWQDAKLSGAQQLQLASYAHDLRLSRRPQASAEAIAVRDFLAPRREADKAKDLWTIFNIVQENTMRGGQTGERVVRGEDGKERMRPVNVRPLNALAAEVDVNRALWSAAASLYEHGEIRENA
jgi:hypothetical protein